MPLPYPPYGTLNYFDQTATQVLNGIKSYRGTGINPAQTGPVIDVLYSAAGNSADEAYYANGIIGYDFEIGATHYNDNPTTWAPATCNPGQQPQFGPSAPVPRTCARPTRASPRRWSSPTATTASCGRRWTTQRHDGAGRRRDRRASSPTCSRTSASRAVRRASIYYTTNGSTPTTASTEWKPNRARALPEPVEIADDATLRWIAVDFKGNTSAVKSKTFMIETDKPTVILNGFTEGQVFTQGRPVPVTYSCADEAGGSGLASCVGTTASGANLPTGTPGTFTYTVTATDNAANETVLNRTYTVLTATNQNGNVNGSVPATLALTLGTAAQFGAGRRVSTRTYTASTTANVISSAGDALLSVADPSSTNTGHLTNGTFFLPQPLQARARNAPTPAPRTTTSARRRRR